jgi:hypothetical protein
MTGPGPGTSAPGGTVTPRSSSEIPGIERGIRVALGCRHHDEDTYHPGETNLRMADVAVVVKEDTAPAAAIEATRVAIRALNPTARIVDTRLPVQLESDVPLAGRRVLGKPARHVRHLPVARPRPSGHGVQHDPDRRPREDDRRRAMRRRVARHAHRPSPEASREASHASCPLCAGRGRGRRARAGARFLTGSEPGDPRTDMHGDASARDSEGW